MNIENKRFIQLSEFNHEYKKNIQNYEYDFQITIYYSNGNYECLNIDDYEDIADNDKHFLLLLIDDIVIELPLDESISDYKIN